MKSEFKSRILFGIAGLVFIVGISMVFGASKADAIDMADLKLTSQHGNWFFEPGSQNLYLGGGGGDQTFVLQNPLKIVQYGSTSLPLMSIVGITKPAELKITSMEDSTERSRSSILFSSFMQHDDMKYNIDRFSITADYLRPAYNGNFLHFQNAKGGKSGANLLTIHSSGNVGIGIPDHDPKILPPESLLRQYPLSPPKSLLHLYYPYDNGTQLIEGLRIERGGVPGQYTTISNYSGWTRINNVTRRGDPYGGLTISFSKDDGNSSVQVFTISDTGNVGIGAVNPDYKLTVAGGIHAREVKVTAAAGADFVFNEDYKLMSLSELEKSVKTNKHLPEIQSADEMVSKGVNIGDLQIKLLQKVEELTLYIIEQNKKIESQQQEIVLLKDKISK